MLVAQSCTETLDSYDEITGRILVSVDEVERVEIVELGSRRYPLSSDYPKLANSTLHDVIFRVTLVIEHSSLFACRIGS